MEMNIDERVHAIVLVRQDDVSLARSKQSNDARSFLDNFAQEIRKEEKGCSDHKLQDSFFLLGRCSMALLFTCPSLSNIAGLMQFMMKIQRKVKDKNDIQMGNFEPFCFPSARILPKRFRYGGTPEAKPIPALVFVRTSSDLAETIQRVTRKTELMEHISAMYLGVGIYNLIFYLRFRTLSDLRDTIIVLREELKSFWETSTLIGVPAGREKEKIEDTSEKIQFSISAKCTNGLEDTACKIMKISPGIENVYFRQGYMDIEVRYLSNAVSDAFELACAIRKIDGVIDTCSVVQLLGCKDTSSKEAGKGRHDNVC